MGKSIVALAKEPEIQASVTKVFDILGGVTNLIEKGSVVVLKPNAGHAAGPETSVCTNPEVVRAVIREVKKAEPKQIVIAESSAIGCNTMECFEVSGIKAVADEEGVELYDIKSEKDLVDIAIRDCKSNINHLKLPRLILSADHIINLPILKAHASMVFSCALKNIKGVVQDKVHHQMHQSNLTMAMMDVWSVVKADINIVDAIMPASGYSPHTPYPIEVGCILGSLDPVAVDRVACDLVGIDVDLVSYFKVAKEFGLGNTEREKIEIVGEKLEDCYRKMWVPYIEDIRNRWPEYQICCEGACSSCQALITKNMEMLKPIGEYERCSDTVVVIGAKNTLPENVPDEKIVLHGNCTRRYLKEHPNALFIKGCPPGEDAMYLTITKGEVVDGSGDQMDWIRPKLEEDKPVWVEYITKQAEEFYSKN